jgi:hypothetical protein
MNPAIEEAAKRLIETARRAAKHYKAMPFYNDRAHGEMLETDADNLEQALKAELLAEPAGKTA